MAKSVLYMSMSLDGFITGPDDGPGNGLGNGGHRLHEGARRADLRAHPRRPRRSGPSSRTLEHRWPSEGSGCCSTTVNLTGTR
jgi:hypothetical protein